MPSCYRSSRPGRHAEQFLWGRESAYLQALIPSLAPLRRVLSAAFVRLLARLGRAGYLTVNWTGIADLASAADVLSTMRAAKLLQPHLVLPPSDQRVVVIAPHPDDEVIGMGGTLTRMMDQRCEILVIYVTSGRGGGSPEQEALSTAEKVGFRPVFLRHAVRSIPVTREAVAGLSQELEAFGPAHVFLPFFLDDHDDHRRVNELLCLSPALSPATMVWGYQVYSALPANAVVDITPVADRKRAAIACYESQFASRDWCHFALGLNAFNVRFMAGTSSAGYAEVFLRLPFPAYRRSARSYFSAGPSRCYASQSYRQPR